MSILKKRELVPPFREVYGLDLLSDAAGRAITKHGVVDILNAIPSLEAENEALRVRVKEAEEFVAGLKKSLADTALPVCPKCNGHGHYLIGSDEIGCPFCQGYGVTVLQLGDVIGHQGIQIHDLERERDELRKFLNDVLEYEDRPIDSFPFKWESKIDEIRTYLSTRAVNPPAEDATGGDPQ